MAEPFAFPWNRLALIAVLAEKAPLGSIGRTALMKHCYFLQSLRNVPLDYHFTLYSYGPFDADVLSDLSYAEALKIVDVTNVQFPGGYGFEIRPGPRADLAKTAAREFLSHHAADIDWVAANFGNLMAADLELLSTIVYADREFAAKPGEKSPAFGLAELVRRVRDVKPRFSERQILARAQELVAKSLLNSTR